MIFKYSNKRKRIKNSDPFVIQTGKHKNSLIDKAYRSDWSEDAFISDNREKETVGNNFDFRVIPFLGALLIFLLFCLIGKTAYLQIVKGDYYYGIAEGNRIRVERIEPKRGVIYDRNGKILVRNQANFILYVIPADLPNSKVELDKIINDVSFILGNIKPEEIKEKFVNINRRSLEAYQPLFIIDNIDYDKAMRLYLESTNWSGLVISTKTRREYLNMGEALVLDKNKQIKLNSISHILGYTGKINDSELKKYGEEYLPIDYIGKMGIEYFWENELKGKSGKKQIEVDALGKEKKILSQEEPVAGNNIVLSLDIEMQKKLEQLLLAQLDKTKLKRASAVIEDPNNGEILAMVSLPAYDNNTFARGISQNDYEALIKQEDKPLFNRCVSGEYPPGSTIKPVMSAAALEEGIIDEHTSFLSTGGIRVGQWFFPDWRAGGHGVTDVKKAIAQSVNTFFYYIGGGYNDFRGLGVERIVKYEKLFGLGEQLGVDLAGEATGFLPSMEWKEQIKGEKWYIGDTYHLSIGQGDLTVTPLQIAAYTTFFANQGKLYRPHFIHQILSDNDKLIKIGDEDPIRENFIKDNNIRIVREGMRQTITTGSARSMSTLPVEAAGKTGTAQWSTKKPTHAWFTGFAPYDKPEIVITILIEEGGEGSTVSVPVAKDFMQWYFGEYKKKISTPLPAKVDDKK
jgi:penicillin-binding protein 2